jgi:hypothetical protein
MGGFSKINFSERVADKLAHKHGVTRDEVCQCFVNRDGGFLEDTREQHRTDPPTQWFVAETNQRRKLKIVFIQRTFGDQRRVDIRTAYDANPTEIAIYERFGRGREGTN